MANQKQIESYLRKLKKIVKKEWNKNNVEASLAAISACAQILYSYNQYYMDELLEKMVEELTSIVPVPKKFIPDDNTILFYDGFGFDLRGWAASFVKALSACGYRLIYVTTKRNKDKIPHILKELGKNVAVYLNMESYVSHIKELNEVFVKYKPKSALFYTMPNDVSGAVVFKAYEGKVKRIQIDLTDHAFWLGTKSADIFFESRDIGACIAIYERGISKDSIVRLDCTPYINKDICNQPLPFDIKSERYIFSGGSLYKTLGDPKLLYYKALREILKTDLDIKFLYAGSGDTSQIKLLQRDYPNRVFFIEERSDFFRLMENSVFYLNTYPMFGGLMMRYSALAGKLPITLKHDHDADGILFHQEELGIEFETYDDFIVEIKRVLKDIDYRKAKEAHMYEAVINEELFKKNLSMLIEKGKTEYSFDNLLPINTKKFQKEYLERFDFWKDIENAIVKKRNKTLIKYFPKMFFKKAIYKLIRR